MRWRFCQRDDDLITRSKTILAKGEIVEGGHMHANGRELPYTFTTVERRRT